MPNSDECTVRLMTPEEFFALRECSAFCCFHMVREEYRTLCACCAAAERRRRQEQAAPRRLF